MKNNFTKRLISLAVIVLAATNAFGSIFKNDYYSKANVSANPTAAGKVYVAYNRSAKNTDSQSAQSGKDSQYNAPSHTYYFLAETTDTGYKFKGWYKEAAGTNRVKEDESYNESITAAENVNNATLNRYAIWEGKSYTIKFDGNSETNGAMSNLAMVYGTAKSLTANNFQRVYTVTYVADGGECGTASATATYTFANWKNGSKTYTNQQSISKDFKPSKDGDEFTLTAQWTAASVKLPTATRADYNFLGWYNGNTKAGDAGKDYTPTATVTLTAHWQPVARVAKAPVAVANLVYNGENQTLIAAGEAVNGTLQYSLDGTNYATSLPQAKDAKTYTVYYKVEALEGGVGVDAATIEVTIAKADPVVATAPAAVANLVYNGEEQILITEGEAEGVTFGYSLDNSSFSTELPTGKDAKTYDVYYKLIGNNNYNDLVIANPVVATIAKADVTLTAPAAYDTLAYNGEEQELITAGVVAGGTLLYSADGENFSDAIPTAKAVGEYTVYYRVDADNNHNSVAKTAIAVSIAKPRAELTQAPAVVNELAYDGVAHTLIVAGLAQGGELQYSLDNEHYATALPEGTNAQTYTIYYKVVGDENHSDLICNPLEVTIAKVALTITAENKETIYGVEAPAFTVTYEGFIEGENKELLGGELGFDCEYAVGSNAGEYTITPNGLTAANYDITFNSGKLTVAKAALSVTAESKDTIYGAPAPEFTVAYNGFYGEDNAEVLTGELVFACDYTVGNNVGEYTIIPSGLTAGNYDITFNNGTLTVAKAALTVNADNKETVYGVEAPEFTATIEGFYGEETIEVLGGELTFACDYTVGNNAGEYAIKASGLTAGNYDITFNNGTLTVAKAALNVTADNKQTTYGVEAPAFTVAYNGFYGEDNAEVLTGELIFACDYTVGNNIGEYVITPSGLTADNYEITFINGTLTVAKADAKVAVAPVAYDTLAYTAEAQTLIVAGIAENGTMLYSLDGENYAAELPQATDAKAYTVYYMVAADENHNDVESATLEVAIAKADAKVAVAPVAYDTLVYNTEAQTLIIAGIAENGTMLYSLDGENYAAELPQATDAKAYTVYYMVAANENYNDVAAASLEVLIAKAAAQLTVAPVAYDTLVYNAEAQTLIIAGETEHGTMMYSLDRENYTTELPQAVNAGEYTIHYYIAGDDNHKDSEAQSLVATIAKADVVLTLEPAQVPALAYTGESQVLITRGLTADGTIEYSADGVNFSATELPQGIAVKDYTVYYRVIGDANHNDLAPVSFKAAIAKADPVVTPPTAIDGLIFTGKPQSLINVGSVIGGEIYYWLNDDDEDLQADAPTAINMGAYTVHYIIFPDENHNEVPEGSVEVRIGASRAELIVAPQAVEGLKYNGTMQTLVIAGKADGGTVRYSIDGGKTYADTLPQAVNAGEYVVYYNVLGDENHSNVAPDSLKVTIAVIAGELAQAPVAAENLAYTGEALTLIAAGEAVGGTLMYSLDGENYAAELPQAINAGEYKIIYYVAGDINHTDVAADSLVATIAKADAKLTTVPEAVANLAYTGEAQALIQAGQAQGGELLYALADEQDAYSATVPVATNAGEYTVYYYVAADNNHNSTELATIAVSVAKAVAELTTAPIAAENLAFTGDTLQLLAQVGAADGGEILYSLTGEEGDYTAQRPAAINAGDYKIFYYVAGDDNHNSTEVATIAVSVAKANAELTIAPVAAENLIYTGEALTLAVAGQNNGGMLEYSLDGENYAAELPTAVNAGDYTVYYRVAEDVNYNGLADESFRFAVNVAKAAPAIIAPVAAELGYTGEAQELLVAGQTEHGTFEYALGEGEFAAAIPTAIEVGEYTVYYRVLGDANHTDLAATEIKVAIAQFKAEITLVPAAVENLVYTGEAYTLIIAGQAQGGELLYSLDGENYTAELPTATNAGEYTVYYCVKGDATHSDLAAKEIVITIAKADVRIITAPQIVAGLMADGTELTLITAGEAEGGDFLYSLDGENYAAELPAAAEAGKYTVYFYVAGDNNHNDTEVDTLEVVVAEQSAATAVDNVAGQVKVTKLIRDNKVFIIRDNRTYTATGLLVE